MNKNYQSYGFTLIELLISMTLLSSILFLGNYSYSLYANQWKKELTGFNQQASKTKSFALIKMLTEGITPLIIKNDVGRPVVHFDGGESGLVGASFNGVVSNKSPVYFELVFEQSENSLGELVYYQIPSDEFLLVSTSQTIEYYQRVVLFSGLKSAKFRYKGYKNFNSISEQTEFGSKRSVQEWFDKYSGNVRAMLPSQIELFLEFSRDSVQLNFNLMNSPETHMSFNLNSNRTRNDSDEPDKENCTSSDCEGYINYNEI